MIAVAGDLLLDVFLLPELRREEQQAGLVARAGGSAANTAAWLAKLGAATTFIGCTGIDLVGDALVADLRARGITTAVRAVPEHETGMVLVEIGPGGERVMRSARGANEALRPEDILAVRASQLEAFHLTGYSFLSPSGLQLLQAASETARVHDALLALDPSSRGVIEQFGRQTLLDAARSAGVRLLLPNAEEAETLAGTRDLSHALEVLARSVDMVVVKDGDRGAAWAHGRRGGYVAIRPVAPLDTTGAGDAFNAGVLAALLQGVPLPDACVEAHLVAARVLLSYGGRPPQ